MLCRGGVVYYAWGFRHQPMDEDVGEGVAKGQVNGHV